ncbi:DNA polymerase III subunit alpha [Haploplasma axanthum]|uniref:DNA-directed DNA polymerase n=1 Tax=Haploplasma axanthum TaxID=29552 RepID=A0A449BDK7_HAPAX|nr:DNA polymerase III subunit alpha [Haploplasma axanthum]VEU80541.1 DNA polymerase III subunit alpha [Haploplasma axanthum]
MDGVLYLQSSYSMLKSMIHLEELVLNCKNNGYKFVALSDEHLHGTYELFKLAKEHKIKPILGIKITVLEPNETVFLVYVKNDFGYENLLALSYLKAKNHKFSFHDLVKHQKGLIFVTAGYKSIIDQTILYGNQDMVLEYLTRYKNNFDDFYIGLSMNHDIQTNVSSDIIYDLCVKNEFKLLPVHQTSYVNQDDIDVYEALIKIENDNNKVDIDADYHFLKSEELDQKYQKYSKVNDGLKFFLETINFEFKLPEFSMPKYQTKNNVDSKEYLVSLARFGLKRRLELKNIKNDTIYIKRLEHELKVIIDMNFENYFLIVYDFIKYAKDNNILVGPGRGSAAGSLVAYCLGITNVDPIYYGLMFERFLNPSRMTMPDIDLDFPDNKRDEVIEYVRNKYGDNHICSITTFSSFALKSSIRDIARVLKIAPERVSGIINAVLENRIDETDYDLTRLLRISKRIEGLYRQTGTHAAGIILSNEDLTKHIPLQTGAFNFSQSQFEAKTLETIGLHKIDFLGIRNLTIITDILAILEKEKIKIDINEIPFNDPKTFELLSEGDTTGLFQLESDGMRSVLKKLKPNKFEELVATLALYRPGPMANIDTYIARRNGEKFKYYHERLEGILKSTYGIIIYQEQIMQVAQEFAGYDLFSADILRAAISKKNYEMLEKERIKFIEGSIKQGNDKELANVIYDYIVKFGDYGFNRSHSVSYGVVAYQMAYLKTHYYKVFMTVLLSNVIGNLNQTNLYIREVISKGIKVLAPDLNLSTDSYKIVDGKILMPLSQVKSLGYKTVNEIIEERKKGEFSSFLDIKERLSKIINEKQLENLIFSGALDFLENNRKTLIDNKDLSNVGYEKFIKDFKMKESIEYSFLENFNNEKDVLGVNIKYDLSKLLKNEKNIYTPSNINHKLEEIEVLGFILNKKNYQAKNGRLMSFLEISDGKSVQEVTDFEQIVTDEYKNKILIFKLRKNRYRDKNTYVLISIRTIKMEE